MSVPHAALPQSLPHAGRPAARGLHTDLRSLQDHSTDLGNWGVSWPAGVVRPQDAGHVADVIRDCAAAGVPVAARGEHHTMGGQSLVAGGVVLDMRGMDTVYDVSSGTMEVAAGALWQDVVTAAAGHGQRFAALTGYLGLTVGGTLSVGGISPAHRLGGQVDLVREAQVVTGEGDVLWCSSSRHPQLFDAVMGGLGQAGVITRVRLESTVVPDTTRTYLLFYARSAPAFEAMRALCDRGIADEVYCLIHPGEQPGTAIYQVIATVLGSGDHCETDLFTGLPARFDQQVIELPYLDHAFFHTREIDHVRRSTRWDQLRKPWWDGFLPDDAVERFVREAVEEMTRTDFSPGTGWVLIFPHDRGAFGRPAFRVPETLGRVWLVDVLSTEDLDEEPSTYATRSTRRNLRWEQRALAYGGRMYPIGARDWTRFDWAEHYGEVWADIVAAKRRWDPCGVLTPGLGIGAAAG